MVNPSRLETPMQILISFNKLIEKYEAMATSKDEFIARKAKYILKVTEDYPELRSGFSDLDLLDHYQKPISTLLEDVFSSLLTNNEIKAASIPFHNIIFNSSNRFKNIVKTAGKDFDLEIMNMPDNDRYIFACMVILDFLYGYKINYKRPFLYEIPDSKGIKRYYKILYNGDFTEIIPTEKAKPITKEDFDELLDNFENIEVWKEKFPPNSYIFKGFVISNMFDVTDQQSISNFKSQLIGEEKFDDAAYVEEFHDIFRSLFGLKDIKVGFSIYEDEDHGFEHIYGLNMNSYLLNNLEHAKCEDSLCKWSYNRLLNENKCVAISDVDKMYKKSKAPHVKKLKEQGVKSAIFAPIANDEGLLGILEIVSPKVKALNSINAIKLRDVLPFVVSSVERAKKEEENLVEAIIQKECTSIHPSVHWRFVKEARNYIKDQFSGKEPVFKQIAFENVYPLFGQIDIKGSSIARNKATQQDLTLQLKMVKAILSKAISLEKLPIYEQFIYQIESYLNDLKNDFKVDTEQQIVAFVKQDIEPMLKHFKDVNLLDTELNDYYNKVDGTTLMLYNYRKQFDNTITLINNEMASLLDKKQVEAQQMYPHFFERFKTDGVEHNLYIGEAITKEDNFNPIYLYNLRLWQLQAMIEMENTYYQMKADFPMQLDVASMILVFNQPLSISFRMDEKQFDVDGTYNARYEIVKKRVDKAFVKGTQERITQKGKITIVYSQKQDEQEYLQYIKFLQSKNYLGDEVEILELEDLQAVTGLKAIRVNVLYQKTSDAKEFYTYEDLMDEIKN